MSVISYPIQLEPTASKPQQRAESQRTRQSSAHLGHQLDAWQEALLAGEGLLVPRSRGHGPTVDVIKKASMSPAITRAAALLLSDRPEAALDALRRVEQTEPDLSVASILRRFAYWRLGQWRHLYASIDLGKAPNTLHRSAVSTLDTLMLASSQFERLEVMSAGRLAGEAYETAHREGMNKCIVGPHAASMLSVICYEMGFRDRAERLASDAIAQLKDAGLTEGLIQCFRVLARVATQRQAYAQAQSLLAEGVALGLEHDCPRLFAAMVSEQARLASCSGDLDQAAAASAELSLYLRDRPVASKNLREELELICTMTRAQVRLLQGFLPESLDVLSSQRKRCLAQQKSYTAFQVSLLLVEAQYRSGSKHAQAQLVKLVRRGLQHGVFQCFVDATAYLGDRLAELREAPTRSEHPLLISLDPFLCGVLARRNEGAVACARDGAKTKSAENLSPRERTILELVARGRCNKRVARVLNIAPETVKSHLKRAFIKLGVRTRAEAVSRAAGLGMLIGASSSADGQISHVF